MAVENLVLCGVHLVALFTPSPVCGLMMPRSHCTTVAVVANVASMTISAAMAGGALERCVHIVFHIKTPPALLLLIPWASAVLLSSVGLGIVFGNEHYAHEPIAYCTNGLALPTAVTYAYLAYYLFTSALTLVLFTWVRRRLQRRNPNESLEKRVAFDRNVRLCRLMIAVGRVQMTSWAVWTLAQLVILILVDTVIVHSPIYASFVLSTYNSCVVAAGWSMHVVYAIRSHVALCNRARRWLGLKVIPAC